MHVVKSFLGAEGRAVVEKDNLIAMQALQAAKSCTSFPEAVVEEAHLVMVGETTRFGGWATFAAGRMGASCDRCR